MTLKNVIFFIKKLMAAAIVCISVCGSFFSEFWTLWNFILLVVGISYIIVPLINIIRKRRFDIRVEGMAFNAVILFFIAFYYYDTGHFEFLFFAGIAYVILNTWLSVLVRRDCRESFSVGRRSILLTVMSTLFIILIVVSPFVCCIEFSIVRIMVYAILMVWPLLYFGRMLFMNNTKWKKVAPGDVVMGQSISIGLLIVCTVHFNDIKSEVPNSLIPLILVMSIYVVDIMKSSLEGEN